MSIPFRVAIVAVVMSGSGLSGCGGSSASTTTTTPTTTSGVYLRLSGHSNRTTAPLALPKQWTVAWHFECASTSPGPFRLTAAFRGGTTETLTDQSGLGGGGYKPFSTPGTVTFSITTSCPWNLKVGAPGTDSAVDTTSSTSSRR